MMLAKTKNSTSLFSIILLLCAGCTHYVAFPELAENEGVLSADVQNMTYSDSQKTDETSEIKELSNNTDQNEKTEELKTATIKVDDVLEKVEAEKQVADLSKPDPVVADVETVSYVVPSKRTPVVIDDMDLINMDSTDSKSENIQPKTKTVTVLPVKKEQKTVKKVQKATAPSIYYLAETILFNNGDSAVDSSYNNSLRKIVKEAKTQNAKIIVQGFASSRTKNTDIISHKMANLKVSVARAESVAKVLQKYGMPKSQIITEGLSDSRPRYKEVMPEGERLNRRAEIYISY